MPDPATELSGAAVLAINRMRRGLNDLERSVTEVRCHPVERNRVDFFLDGVPWSVAVDENARRALREANARIQASLILSLMFEGAAISKQTTT